MICPAVIDVTSIPPIIGNSSSPDAVGLAPRTIWRKSGRYVMEPNIAKPTMSPTALLTTKTRLRKRCGGGTGPGTPPPARGEARGGGEGGGASARHRQGGREHDECEGAERQIHVKDPPPRQVGREESAE